MLKLPVKKCYFLAKLCVLLMLVVTILSLFEQWRGGKRVARAQFTDATEEEYERQILEDEARIVPGLGEGGAPAYLSSEEKELGAASEKKYAINTYLSDRISFNRTLKDHRNPACKRVTYDAELPSASVIIIFHNEPYSVVLRTVWSVINTARRDQPWHRQASPADPSKLGYRGQDPNSEFVYLKEIILVDDNSTLPALRGKLSHYVRTRLPPGLVRVVRLPDRQGLMRARLAGARTARGDALVFLDAHCEGQADWLRPLLQRLRHKRDAVVTPVIDVIQENTFQLDADYQHFQVGGFTFVGHFTWVDVPEREKRRRGSDIAPTWSPTMAGGLFAVSRAYYWELGAYDEQMTGWGGENLEMSFRVWQCGGTLETIPCSRVGHVFRAFHPYGMPADSDTHGINTARMAEVWMDEYAELFYLHRPDLRKNPIIGDVTHRRVLREKLRCKSFRWYLDNVYKEKFVPVRDVSAYGRVQNPATGLCLDTMQREQEAAPLGLYPCHSTLAATQYLSLSLSGQLRDEEKCAQLQYTRRSGDESVEDESRALVMVSCGKPRSQQWRYLAATKQLQHVESGLCIDTGGASAAAGGDARARSCREAPAQQWSFDYGEHATSHNGLLTADQEERLHMLKRQRRKSRSLMSMEVAAAGARRARHKRRGGRRKKKQKSHKNKFILVVERTLMNNSREHLEVDIHCAHKKLLPNNSFVRDLVTILNEKNIRVINNGRVFERNRVTQLGRAPKVLEKLDLDGPTTTEPAPSPATEKTVERAGDPMVKKSRVRPPATTEPDSTAQPKRIIIEDFVEIKPAAYTAPKRSKKRKHKHSPSLRARLTPPSEPERSEESPLLLSKRVGVPDAPDNALDNAPDATDVVRRASDESDDEYWNVGMGTAKSHNSSHAHPTRAHEDSDQTQVTDAHEAHEVHEAHGAHETHEAHEVHEGHEAHEAVDVSHEHAAPKAHEPHSWDLNHDARFRVVSADGQSGEFRELAAPRSRVLPARARLFSATSGRGDLPAGDEDEQATPRATFSSATEAGAPVKLVMRSNLTFNLGDELFSWRRDNTGPDELVIPAPEARPPDSSASDSSAAD